MTDHDQVDVVDTGARWEIRVGGDLAGYADHHVVGDVTVIPHTFTDPRFRGRGLAAVLVRQALDDIRAAGRRVDPQCWYVAEFIDANPEYSDLLAR